MVKAQIFLVQFFLQCRSPQRKVVLGTPAWNHKVAPGRAQPPAVAVHKVQQQ